MLLAPFAVRHGAVRQDELLGRALHEGPRAVRLVPALQRHPGARAEVHQEGRLHPHGGLRQLAPLRGHVRGRLRQPLQH